MGRFWNAFKSFFGFGNEGLLDRVQDVAGSALGSVLHTTLKVKLAKVTDKVEARIDELEVSDEEKAAIKAALGEIEDILEEVLGIEEEENAQN